ncbi:MAG: phosphotransferase family protein [SAR324 cluster bacterium]|nr:phosphotransferase family protein [SAR324 cluster bacterium]
MKRKAAAIENPEGFAELIPMRPDERIDPVTVGDYLRGELADADGTPEILQFEGGKANLTYLLRYGEREFVLRRPPLGPVPAKSHDMEREARVLSVLYRAYPLAPRAYHYCADPSIAGAPFFVMERRKGIVIREQMPERFQGRPELNRRMSAMIVDGMAALHGIDPESIGLGGLGRPEGFMERQIAGWKQRWEGAKIVDVPGFDELHDWLMARVPRPQRVSLVHNDFKLDNMMVDRDDPGVCVAVFDWDMCTVGDPLADLGTLLGYWAERGDSGARQAFAPMPTQQDGFYTRAEVVERYGRKTGLDMSDAEFYEIFALYKTAVVIQQLFVRYHRGLTQDTRFQGYDRKGADLIQVAWAMANRGRWV